MLAEQVGGATIDRCPACDGHWFDRTKLAGYLKAEGLNVAWRWGTRVPLPSHGGRVCPRCRTATLLPHVADGLGFDRCTACFGVFLSATQLRAMLDRAEYAAARRETASPALIVGFWVFDILTALLLRGLLR